MSWVRPAPSNPSCTATPSSSFLLTNQSSSITTSRNAWSQPIRTVLLGPNCKMRFLISIKMDQSGWALYICGTPFVLERGWCGGVRWDGVEWSEWWGSTRLVPSGGCVPLFGKVFYLNKCSPFRAPLTGYSHWHWTGSSNLLLTLFKQCSIKWFLVYLQSCTIIIII